MDRMERIGKLTTGNRECTPMNAKQDTKATNWEWDADERRSSGLKSDHVRSVKNREIRVCLPFVLFVVEKYLCGPPRLRALCVKK
jgi:hypothetical protein